MVHVMIPLNVFDTGTNLILATIVCRNGKGPVVTLIDDANSNRTSRPLHRPCVR